MEILKFKKGTTICAENSPGDEMYIILSGRVKVFKNIDDEELHLSFLGPGDFFGEMCLLLEGLRTASVTAVQETELLGLSREGLINKIREDPDFGLRMISTLAKRLANAHGVISSLEGIKRSLEILYGFK